MSWRPMPLPFLTAHPGALDPVARESLLAQKGCAVWLTGLSGSGKSTIARALEQALYRQRKLAYVLDGDNLRHGLNADLGFTNEDRQENVRRTGEVAALFVDAGLIVIAALISPFRADRDGVRNIVGEDRFLEVFVDVPIEVCEQRDPKGLYRKARSGELPEFTGISSPYEPPLAPTLTTRNVGTSVAESVDEILRELERRGALGQR